MLHFTRPNVVLLVFPSYELSSNIFFPHLGRSPNYTSYEGCLILLDRPICHKLWVLGVRQNLRPNEKYVPGAIAIAQNVSNILSAKNYNWAIGQIAHMHGQKLIDRSKRL